MRTTIDIDDPILAELKRMQRRDGRSLGRLVSDLLVQSLAQQPLVAREPAPPAWVVQSMGAMVDLSDREALLDALDAAEAPDAPVTTSPSHKPPP